MNLWYLGLGIIFSFSCQPWKMVLHSRRSSVVSVYFTFSKLRICLSIMGKWEGSLCFPTPQCGTRQSAQAVRMMGKDVTKNSASYFYCRVWFTYSCSHSFLLLLRVLSHSLSPEFKKGFYGLNPAVLDLVRMALLGMQCHPWDDQTQSLWPVHL